MKRQHYLLPVLLAIGLLIFPRPAPAESHRATRLGNPATVFAPTIYFPADLRARFADPGLHPDFIEILSQWGWPGNPDDMFAAAATNDIVEWNIPVGETMPFMSSREAGKPVCLRNVTWAGRDPIHAYAFIFHSNGHSWRCVTPKPCSNFFVEDLGADAVPALTIDCSAPDKIEPGHSMQVCLEVHNTGSIAMTNISVALTLPGTTEAVDFTDGGVTTNNAVYWTIDELPADAVKGVCAALKMHETETLSFNATGGSSSVPPSSGSHETEVAEIPTDSPDSSTMGTNSTESSKEAN